VVDKPAGLLSVGDERARRDGVAELLAEQGLRARAVHRLDREVSGCLVLALDEAAREALEQAFRDRRVHKRYWALARGAPAKQSGEIHFPLLEEGPRVRVSARGQAALTRYRVLQRFARATELELEPVTGRRNQLRVHLAHSGQPLIGERKYAQGKQDPLRASRLALHAWRVAFEHPLTGEELEVRSPLPEALERLRQRAAAQD
jgi:RluA family pseudouridine synthase